MPDVTSHCWLQHACRVQLDGGEAGLAFVVEQLQQAFYSHQARQKSVQVVPTAPFCSRADKPPVWRHIPSLLHKQQVTIQNTFVIWRNS